MERIILGDNNAKNGTGYHLTVDVPCRHLHLRKELDVIFSRILLKKVEPDTLAFLNHNHHQDLSPMWHVIFDSLSFNPHIKKIVWNDTDTLIPLLPSVIRNLQNNSQLTRVLYSSLQGDESNNVISLCSSLHDNRSLKVLSINVMYANEKSLEVLGEYISHRCYLDALAVHFNVGNWIVKNINTTLQFNTTITYLNLSESDIGDEGAKCVSDYLKENHFLRDLVLAHNLIADQGAECLLQVLMINRTLRTLDIRGNSVSLDLSRRFIDQFDVSFNLWALFIYYPMAPSPKREYQKELDVKAKTKIQERIYAERQEIFKRRLDLLIFLQMILFSSTVFPFKSMCEDTLYHIYSMISGEDHPTIQKIVHYASQRESLSKGPRDFISIFIQPTSHHSISMM